MTLKTWKEEFYPKPPHKSMTRRQAIEHSIRKWEGLTSANLKKHSVYLGFHKIMDADGKILMIESDTCALCVKYLDESAAFNDWCKKCPLCIQLGHPCDSNDEAPYSKWVATRNPRHMIKALRKLLEE